MTDSVKRGYLHKTPPKAGKNCNWKERFFELFANGDLAYSKSHNPKDDPKGVVRLREVTHISDAQCLLVSLYSIGLHLPGRSYFLRANDRRTIDEWCIQFQKYIPSYVNLEPAQKLIPQYAVIPEQILSKLPTKKGLLTRDGRQRNCEVSEGHLRIYANLKMGKLESLFELRTCMSVQELPDSNNNKFMFSIDFVTGGQALILGCETPFLKNEWIVDLLQCIQVLSHYRDAKPFFPEMSLHGFCDSPESPVSSTNSSSDNLSRIDLANNDIYFGYKDLSSNLHAKNKELEIELMRAKRQIYSLELKNSELQHKLHDYEPKSKVSMHGSRNRLSKSFSSIRPFLLTPLTHSNSRPHSNSLDPSKPSMMLDIVTCGIHYTIYRLLNTSTYIHLNINLIFLVEGLPEFCLNASPATHSTDSNDGIGIMCNDSNTTSIVNIEDTASIVNIEDTASIVNIEDAAVKTELLSLYGDLFAHNDLETDNSAKPSPLDIIAHIRAYISSMEVKFKSLQDELLGAQMQKLEDRNLEEQFIELQVISNEQNIQNSQLQDEISKLKKDNEIMQEEINKQNMNKLNAIDTIDDYTKRINALQSENIELNNKLKTQQQAFEYLKTGPAPPKPNKSKK